VYRNGRRGESFLFIRHSVVFNQAEICESIQEICFGTRPPPQGRPEAPAGPIRPTGAPGKDSLRNTHGLDFFAASG
jgi:hypothetical protein